MPNAVRSATLTFDQLRISPFNVRINRADTKPTESFARTIEAFGLIHPLRVHPMRSPKGVFGVHIGRRRYETIGWLIEQGRFPADWPIDVTIRDGASDADLLQESEVENGQRTDLRPYEVFQGVAKAHKRGATIEQISLNIGEDEAEIRRWLRLGNLARPIFEALEAGTISVDQAKAYGATEDHALQLAAFESVSAMHETARMPKAIRAALGIGDAELQRFLRLIGPEAYEAAGGRFERDLFSADDPLAWRVIDPVVLRGLVDAELAAARVDLRERTGKPDLRFIADEPRNEFRLPDQTLRVDMDRPIPAGDIVGRVVLGREGVIETGLWWASLKAKTEAERGPAPARAAALAAPRAVVTTDRADNRPVPARQDESPDTDTLQVLRSLRRMMLRGRMVDVARTQGLYKSDGPALDWLVWSQLRLMLTETRITQLGSGYISNQSADPELAREHVRATEAWRRWSMALYELQRESFMSDPNLADAFLDYRCSGARVKQLAIAVVAGLALERSLAAGMYRVPAHDVLAAELGLDDAVAHELCPPTAGLLDLLTMPQRLAIAEPLVESASFGPWSRLKSAELTRAVLNVVTGASKVVRASVADAAARWVHPLLRFDPYPPGPEGDEPSPVNDVAVAQLDLEDAVRGVAA